MPIVEKSGLMKYKDAAGNTTIMYPITTMENVDGVEEALAEKAAASHTHTKSQISDFPSSMPASDVKAWAKADAKPTYSASEVGAAPASHTHDDRYYTETEMDTKLAGKAGTSVASASANGLMSSTDTSKLDGIAPGANKTTVDTAMSTTSTNPVQNKVVAAAINSAIKSAIQNTWEARY